MVRLFIYTYTLLLLACIISTHEFEAINFSPFKMPNRGDKGRNFPENEHSYSQSQSQRRTRQPSPVPAVSSDSDEEIDFCNCSGCKKSNTH